MIDFFLQVVIRAVAKLTFCWPGATVRWLFLHKKKTFKEILDDVNLNTAIGIIVLSSIVGVIYINIKK